MARPRAPMDPAARARLRQAAAEEFARLGFERSSLNRIVETSGVAKSSVYHHVGGKQAVYDDLLAHLATLVDDALDLPDPATLTAETYLDALSRAAAGLERSLAAHPEARAIGILAHRTEPDAALRALFDRWAAVARAFVERGQELGVLRDDVPPDLLTDVALAALLAIDAWALAQGDAGTDAARAALAMLRDAVAPPTRPTERD
ncbi:TetR/AcrR family transcriptional regulator [Cellulosimicrobium cellulans]|uniref:TetR/AcrR family transcriptional regulator n=1 Tax=Cellulosimicrobium cellulans TaxID=1710 RepID=UPI001EDB792E|nr:TetR/AcrR family transcriptional regulator [Cellulosimicrobium cellulans]UKJ63459.1 TetR/AcrR family transcriptional regulator [Cellulosimicrobium cellulans]